MTPALLFQIRPTSAWRTGDHTGARGRLDPICHSDTLYAALCWAAGQLGWRDDWLEATARADPPAFRFSSLFPSVEDHRLVPAPAHLWPPPGLARLRASGVRWIPASLVPRLAAGEPWNEEHWEVDGTSDALLRRGRRAARQGLWRVSLRSHAAVDRLAPGRIAPGRTACLEFSDGAQLWAVAAFCDEPARAQWRGRIEAVLRLLADSGIGARRGLGWGRFVLEQIQEGLLTELVLGAPPGPPAEPPENPTPPVHWLLSLFSPAPGDQVDWSRGAYSLIERQGRSASAAAPGVLEKRVRMVREGSVLAAAAPPLGAAPDVAPEGFPHPVYRAGFAVSIPVPWRTNP